MQKGVKESIRGCEDNAGGQKRTQKKPRTRNSPKPPCIITGAKNLNPFHTTGVFFASILAVRLGHSPRYPRLRGQRRQAKEDAKKAENGSRTHNLRFTKPLLCQLSYLGVLRIIYLIIFFAGLQPVYDKINA